MSGIIRTTISRRTRLVSASRWIPRDLSPKSVQGTNKVYAISHIIYRNCHIWRSTFLRTTQNSSFDEWNSAIPFVSALIGCIRTHYTRQNEDEITNCHDRVEVSIPSLQIGSFHWEVGS